MSNLHEVFSNALNCIPFHSNSIFDSTLPDKKSEWNLILIHINFDQTHYKLLWETILNYSVMGAVFKI